MSWRGTECFGAQLRACSAVPTTSTPLVHGVYGITGGLGGLGLRAAKLLVDGGALGVVLSSRSGLVSTSAVAAWRSAAIWAIICDAGNALDTVALLARKTFVGMLHAAGVLYDKMLWSMVGGDVQASFAPKALAASHVQAVVMGTPLAALGLFSSIASTFGSFGQANYAAANSYLDALARSRRCHGALVSSLQIPAVSGSGMGATTFDKEQLDAMGAISLNDFASCLSIVLMPVRAATECTLAPLARALLASTATSALSELSHDKDEHIIATPVTGSALAHSLVALSTSQRRTRVEASVLRIVRELTAVSLTAETPLMEAGRRLARGNGALVAAAFAGGRGALADDRL
jgi:hypothetical protein